MDEKDFKGVVASFPTGVLIMTTRYDSIDYGITVNSFTSVSLDPPLTLFCINKSAGSYNAFINSDFLCANFLSHEQENLAVQFSSKLKDKFVEVDYYYSSDNIPLLKNTKAHLELKRYAVIDAGDHSIILGKATSGAFNQEIAPLSYFNKKFLKTIS
jgi:flavin reductase (DIM6/NTAB) family NADH-FMN oxidoreductase RutF